MHKASLRKTIGLSATLLCYMALLMLSNNITPSNTVTFTHCPHSEGMKMQRKGREFSGTAWEGVCPAFANRDASDASIGRSC